MSDFVTEQGFRLWLMEELFKTEQKLKNIKKDLEKYFPETYNEWLERNGYAKPGTKILSGKTCHLSENRTVSVVDFDSENKYVVGLKFTRFSDEGEEIVTGIVLTREAADALTMLLYTNPGVFESMICRAGGKVPNWEVSDVNCN